MQYHKTINLLDDETIYQPSILRTKNWVEINDQLQLLYNTNNQTKLKAVMQKSSLCDHSNA